MTETGAPTDLTGGMPATAAGGGTALSDEERAVLRERTLREARAAARLTHPCVTSVYDVVEDEGGRFEGFSHVEDWVPQRLVTATGPNPLPR